MHKKYLNRLAQVQIIKQQEEDYFQQQEQNFRKKVQQACSETMKKVKNGQLKQVQQIKRYNRPLSSDNSKQLTKPFWALTEQEYEQQIQPIEFEEEEDVENFMDNFDPDKLFNKLEEDLQKELSQISIQNSCHQENQISTEEDEIENISQEQNEVQLLKQVSKNIFKDNNSKVTNIIPTNSNEEEQLNMKQKADKILNISTSLSRIHSNKSIRFLLSKVYDNINQFYS